MVCSLRGEQKERSAQRQRSANQESHKTNPSAFFILSVDLDCAGGITPVDAVIVTCHLKTNTTHAKVAFSQRMAVTVLHSKQAITELVSSISCFHTSLGNGTQGRKAFLISTESYTKL